MQKNNTLKSYFNLHIIVFIWGFTAILGALISLQALDLVWYRMLFAVIFILIYILIKRISLKIPIPVLYSFLFAGLIIALHWLTFFKAIKVSNISITLACLSTGSFFASILEPIYYKKKVNWLDILFGLFAIVGLYFVTSSQISGSHGLIYTLFEGKSNIILGIELALTSAFLSALFSVINGKFAQEYNPTVISFYELFGGVLFLSIYLFFTQGFSVQFFNISINDLLWLFVLSSICTAYAFIASVGVMKYLSPYTVMLTINLEPIYGIILALIIFQDKEKMSPQFYLGAAIILFTVVINGIIKNRNKNPISNELNSK
jgi:drug/metabolite transporter (DMT)-like permease